MKKLLYILSHRSVFVALSLVAQIGALFFLLSFFSESDAAFYWSCIALSIVSSLLILGSRMEPAYKIAWLLLVLPFPVFGGFFYFLIGGNHISTRLRRKMQGIAQKTKVALIDDFKAEDLLPLGEQGGGPAPPGGGRRRAGPLFRGVRLRPGLHQHGGGVFPPGGAGL